MSDIERSKQCYQEAFGFHTTEESTEEGRRFVFLGDGSRLILTLWQQSGGHDDNRQPELHHLSFQVETITEVRDAEARLRGMEARFLYEGVVPHAGG